MKKIIGIISLAMLPVFASAQTYYHMSNGYGFNAMPEPTFWGIFLPILWFIFMISAFIFWLLMLVDAIKNAPDNMKLVWVVVIIFTALLGALIYYFIAYRPRVCKTCGQVMQKKHEGK